MKKEYLNGLYGVIIGVTITAAGFVVAGQGRSDTAASDAGLSHNQSMTDELSRLNGEEFEKVFLEEMIVHHEGAVDMAELVASRSNREEMRRLADDIIRTQSQETNMMNGWLEEWGYMGGMKNDSGDHMDGGMHN